MQLHISQVSENNQFYVKIQRSKDFKDYVWQELIKTIKQFQDSPFKEEKEFIIVAEWVSFLSILHDLSDLRDINKFELNAVRKQKIKIQETIKNQNLISSESYNIELNEKEIKKLKSYGFSKIQLTKFQIRDLKQLLKLSNGANFRYKDLEKLL